MSTEKTTKLTQKKGETIHIEDPLNVSYADADNYKTKIKRIVTIEPYFDPETKFMGYEKYGYSGFPGGAEVHNLSYIKVGLDKVRYLTGLDVKALHIVNNTNTEERQALIDEIEKTLDWLAARGYTRELLDAENQFFWGERTIRVENNTRIDLDFENPDDVIMYWNILGRGYDVVALNKAEAKKSNNLVKWYLSEINAEADSKIEIKRVRNKAKRQLDELFEERPRSLFLLAKNILSPDNYFKNDTPISLIYDKLDEFIDGNLTRLSKKEAAVLFSRTAEKSNEDLLINALVRDAIFFRIVKKRGDGLFVNLETGNTLGKNENEMYEQLKNPLFASDYESVYTDVNKKWGK